MNFTANERLCPLCGCGEGEEFFHDARMYYRCPGCGLVFVPERWLLSEAEERAVYDLHENGPEDAGYRKFLARLFVPVRERIAAGSRGLDFGSGPGPTLSVMFTEAGHAVRIYDPFYADDASVFDEQYDFITASEVVEHLRRPREELRRLWKCLKPGGWLGIMTKRVIDREAFATWHYKSDPTHVCFYSTTTFEWLAGELEARLEVVGDDVVLLEKVAESE